MRYINEFETTDEYNQAVGEDGKLSNLKHFVARTKDTNEIYLKKENILIIITSNSGVTVKNITDNSNGYEIITLDNGRNKLINWNYGFYFDVSMNQHQITSFDLSKYDTSSITDMHHMFFGCSGLISLDLSKFNTSRVIDMSGMFQYCNKLSSLDVSKFDTSNTTSLSYMFGDCTGLTFLDLSNFDTTNVTSVSGLFNYCLSLTSLDLSNFDISKVNDAVQMFNYCGKLTYIKCKQAFKDWCWKIPDSISLPTAMRNGGNGTWEIVD